MTEPADGPLLLPPTPGAEAARLALLVRPRAELVRPASGSGPWKTPRKNLCRAYHASPRPNGSRPPRASPPGPVPTSGPGRPPPAPLGGRMGPSLFPMNLQVQPPERAGSAPARPDPDDPASPAGLPELCLGHRGRIPSPADVARAPDGKGRYKRDRQMAPDNRREQRDGSGSLAGEGALPAARMPHLVPSRPTSERVSWPRVTNSQL